METKRRQSAKVKRDPEGNIICSCGCGQRPEPPRRTWFSDACVQAWKEINDPATIRAAVLKRDGGICAACGVDANKAYGEWCRQYAESMRLVSWFVNRDRFNKRWDDGKQVMVWNNLPSLPYRIHEKRVKELRAKWAPPGAWTLGRSSGWDADHIIPVVEGGGMCGLENYRTLCHPCHKEATKSLAARRAAARKNTLNPI